MKFQQQQEQAQQQGGSQAGQEQLENPFGGLGDSATAPAAPGATTP